MLGMRVRAKNIEIYFNWQGKKRFIKLNSQDINQAKQIRIHILECIQQKTLTEEYLQQIVNPDFQSFSQVAVKYLRFNQANQKTKDTYKLILNHHWFPYLAQQDIKQITYETLIEIIINKNISDKYLNQILIPLRGVFDTAIKLKYITDNPTLLINNRKLQSKLPDPFTRQEMEKLLQWLKQTNEYYYLFYELSFWTGLRPSELLALTWQDVDDDFIYIYKNRVDGIEKQVTKTKTARQVILNQRSKQALEDLKKYTNHQSYLFIVPNTQKPYYSNRHFKQRFNQALKACHIRRRPSYNTRHTYATMLLMDGVNPTLVANQLGHSLQMLIKTYARWLNSERDKLEISKLRVK